MMKRTIHLSEAQYQALSSKDSESLYITEAGVYLGASRLVKETQGITEVTKLKIGSFVLQVNGSGILEIHDTQTDNYFELTAV